MAAVAHLVELPPVTALTLVPDTGCELELAEAERLVDAHRYDDAAERLARLWDDLRHDPSLALRQRLALAWAEMMRGALEDADELLAHADGIAQSARFDAADRAEVAFRRGCVALKRTDVTGATTLFTRALDQNERAPRPRIRLAAQAHEWRSRCHQVRRDWDAAARDADRSLELATQAGDELAQAHALFQASCVAERQKQWLLARMVGEQALELYRRHGDTLRTARMLNNLGGIAFLLGDADAAEATLVAAIESADEAGSEPDLAQAVNSLAQVYLRSGRPGEARVRAQRAVELLEGRTDFLDELGNAQLVVANAFAAEGEGESATRWLDAADATFAELGCPAHAAAALVARGDLVRAAGDAETAADLYRRAADSLQDVHF